MDFEDKLGLDPNTKDVRHNGLKKDSCDESKTISVLKEAIDDFPANPEERTPPMPEFDYLFTNWPDKNPSEKTFKPKVSNQLDKNVSSLSSKKLDKKQAKQESELTPEEQEVLKRWETMKAAPIGEGAQLKNRFENSMRKLTKKPWQKWGKLEWKIAGRVTKHETITDEPEDAKKKQQIFSIKPLLLQVPKEKSESINRSKSKSLVEMKFLDFLFKKAMTTGHAKPEKEEGSNSIYTRINDIVSKTLKEFGLKATSPKKYDDADVMGINYQLKIGKESYAIHTYFLKGNKVFMYSIWDKEENRLLLTLSEGYLRQYYYLIGIGKEKLRSWMENHNGKSESGKDHR